MWFRTHTYHTQASLDKDGSWWAFSWSVRDKMDRWAPAWQTFWWHNRCRWSHDHRKTSCPRASRDTECTRLCRTRSDDSPGTPRSRNCHPPPTGQSRAAHPAVPSPAPLRALLWLTSCQLVWKMLNDHLESVIVWCLFVLPDRLLLCAHTKTTTYPKGLVAKFLWRLKNGLLLEDVSL